MDSWARAALDHAAGVEHHDLVHPGQRRQVVGDEDEGAAPGRVEQGGQEGLGGLRVEAGIRRLDPPPRRTRLVPGPGGIVAVVAVALTAALPRGGREGWAFAAGAVGTGAAVAAIFVDLYPRVLVSSTHPAFDLTTADTASGSYSLKVITVVALVLLPVVLACSAWIYTVLRRRVGAPRVGIPQPRQAEPSGEPVVRPRQTF